MFAKRRKGSRSQKDRDREEERKRGRNFLRRVASAKASLPRVYLLKELAALLLLFLQHTTRYTERTRYKSIYVLSERGRLLGEEASNARPFSSPFLALLVSNHHPSSLPPTPDYLLTLDKSWETRRASNNGNVA